MLLNEKQVKSFWRLWPQACRANGWTKERGLSASEIEAKRKEVLRACGFDSLTRVDKRDGFTKVKNRLLILIGTDLKAAGEDQDTTANTARMHRHVIEKEIIPCLVLYVEDVTGYVATIIADAIRHYKIDRPTRPPTLGDLTPEQMHRALMTLSARLNQKRRAARDTIHDMKTKAGLECNCRLCCNRRLAQQPSERVHFSPVAASADPDWNV